MKEIEVTPTLLGDFGELLYKHSCIQKNFVYIRVKDIYYNLTPRRVLNFKCGEETYPIEIPEKLEPEIWMVSKPTFKKENEETTVFDYLSINKKHLEKKEGIYRSLNVEKFNWVEIKSNSSELSSNQSDTIKKCEIPVSIFRFEFKFPEKITQTWEIAKIIKILNQTKIEFVKVGVKFEEKTF